MIQYNSSNANEGAPDSFATIYDHFPCNCNHCLCRFYMQSNVRLGGCTRACPALSIAPQQSAVSVASRRSHSHLRRSGSPFGSVPGPFAMKSCISKKWKSLPRRLTVLPSHRRHHHFIIVCPHRSLAAQLLLQLSN